MVTLLHNSWLLHEYSVEILSNNLSGWDEGISQLSVGERARIIMTPDVAYGTNGIPGLFFSASLG
jgi:FKBP-type peptidyl-prolyl cis-trans isomerase